jgi:hypothetical protein
MLNLTATKTEEIIVKDYLENNVSDALAEKINNGVKIEKDGKTLISPDGGCLTAFVINKKTLATFMNYACEEARKQAEKGARFACVGNDTVFSWAVHYFEEDSIEGTLYNEDGTEYKPNKAVTAKPEIKYTAPQPKSISLFDLFDEKEPETTETDTAPEPKENDTENPAEPETTETDDDTEDDVFEQPKIISHTVHNEPAEIPGFLINLFGDTLKIEVNK